jgi:hypothetical protein
MRFKISFGVLLLVVLLSVGVVYAFSGSLFADVTSSSGCEGAFFDLTAGGADITITGFETNQAGTANTQVYYKAGTYAGFETNAGAWSLLGSATVNGGSGFIQTLYPLPVGSLTIPAGETYGILIYSGFFSRPDVHATRYANGTATFSNADLTLTAGAASCTGGNFNPFDGAESGRIWRGIVHYETDGSSSAFIFADGRINRDDAAAPFVVYPHLNTTGETGLVVYDAYNNDTQLLIVDASEIAAIPAMPEQNTLIAASADDRVSLYRLTTGEFQVMGPEKNGKEYVMIFPAITPDVEYASFEQ